MASLFALLAAYDLGPGDVVYVDAGHYHLLRNTLLTQNDSGVQIQGPPGDAVALLDRGNTAQGSCAIELANADNVTIDRLHVTGRCTASTRPEAPTATASRSQRAGYSTTSTLGSCSRRATTPRVFPGTSSTATGCRLAAMITGSASRHAATTRSSRGTPCTTGTGAGSSSAGCGPSWKGTRPTTPVRGSRRTSAPAVPAATGSSSVATRCSTIPAPASREIATR